MKLILEARRRALEELLSDFTAYFIFGLSALFALEDFAAADILDAVPEEEYDYYPPWRMRIRETFNLATRELVLPVAKEAPDNQPIDLILSAAHRRLHLLEEMSKDQSDWGEINADEILRRAYQDVPDTLQRARAFLEQELSHIRYEPRLLESDLIPLVERISLGVPPDESSGGVSPDFRSAVIAGWLYNTAKLPIPFTTNRVWESADDAILNRLILKAVQSVDLKSEVERWRKGMT